MYADIIALQLKKAIREDIVASSRLSRNLGLVWLFSCGASFTALLSLSQGVWDEWWSPAFSAVIALVNVGLIAGYARLWNHSQYGIYQMEALLEETDSLMMAANGAVGTPFDNRMHLMEYVPDYYPGPEKWANQMEGIPF